MSNINSDQWLLPSILCGNFTADVESFPSYLCRLAFDHNVNVGVLIKTAYRRAKNNDRLSIEISEPRFTRAAELVRPFSVTKTLVSLFEAATGEQLQGSILNFLPVKSSGEVVDGFRWCPECFNEMQQRGCQPYFKLIWHMSAVTACPIHRTPFLSRCARCGCDQTSHVRSHPIDCCQKCGGFLSCREERLSGACLSNSWADIGFDIVRLFEDCASNNYLLLQPNGSRTSLDSLERFYRRIGQEPFYRKAFTSGSLRSLEKGKSMSLLCIRRTAQFFNLPIYDFMSGNAGLTSASFEWIGVRNNATKIYDVKKRSNKDHLNVFSRVMDYLSKQASPVSLKKLSRDCSISIGYLEYRHPDLASDIVAKHEQFEMKEKCRRIYHAQTAALKFFLDEKYAKFPKSRKQAYKVIREETGLSKFLLLRAIRVAYVAISSGNQHRNGHRVAPI